MILLLLCREFFEDLAKHMKWNHQQDWYKMKLSDIVDFGGGDMMLNYYRNSIAR
jgi:hypothetical protein